MTPTVTLSQDQEIRRTPPPPLYQAQRALAFIGLIGLYALAMRHRSDLLHPLPTLPGRLHQAKIPLLEIAAAGFCVLWTTVLVIWNRRSQSGPIAKPSGSRAQILLFLWPVLLTLAIGAPLLIFLFPVHGRALALAALVGFGILCFAAPFLKTPGRVTRIARGSYAGGIRRDPIRINTLLLVVIVAGACLGLDVAVAFLGKHAFPTHAAAAGRIVVALTTVLFTGFFFWVQQHRDSDPLPAAIEDHDAEADREGRRRRVLQAVLLCAYVGLMVGVMTLPVGTAWRHLLFRGQVLVVAGYAWVLRRIKFSIYRTGHKGDYERALRLDRFWGAMPFYGSSLRGPILFNAGRYREAQAYLKPLAFDRQGHPRLSSTELYCYTLALVNDDQPAAAEPLLEAAVKAVAKNDVLKVALASCLLTQEKDPERARRLLEEAMASGAQGLGDDRRADNVRRIARYAWALAACGQRQDAQKQIDEAEKLATGLRPEDAAGVHYFVGEAWREMGDGAKAQAAYNEAIRLQPTGVTALSVKKALAKIGTRWHPWQPAT